jgi:hypothetical protein
MTEPIIVSYSELDTFRQCPLKHHFAYKMRYKKPVKEDSALAKGSLYHQVMETHYKIIMSAQQKVGRSGRIPLPDEKPLLKRIRKAVQAILRDERTGEFLSAQHELISWMYDGYVEKYGIDRQWKIMAVEHNIVTPLRDARGRRTRYHIKCKIDLLVMERANGRLWVIDHKSGQNLPTQMDLEIDDQFGLYTWAMREMGKPVAGSIHSANRTTQNAGDKPENQDAFGQPLKSTNKKQSLDQRMSRTFLSRGEKELTNLALDAYWAARAAYAPPQYQARYSSPDPRTCGWKCDFKEAHLVMRKGQKPEKVLHDYGFVIDKTRH